MTEIRDYAKKPRCPGYVTTTGEACGRPEGHPGHCQGVTSMQRRYARMQAQRQAKRQAARNGGQPPQQAPLFVPSRHRAAETTDLEPETLAAARRVVIAHDAADLLPMLGLEAA